MLEVQCIVVTPERTVCDVASQFVAVTLDDGEIGIAPGRAPMIGRLGCGEMRITADGRISRYYVQGGFIEVANDVVTVLTDRAIPAQQLEEAVIQEQLEAARARRATTPETMAARDRAVTLSRAQLRVARRVS
jgi:F-type H+-transporting ATPase subunit epsilon